MDRFGVAVWLRDDLLVVNAMEHDAGGINSGAAYVYRRDGKHWAFEQKLRATDAAAGDHFGRFAVSLRLI